ncbi:MAG: hypothetical protein U0514_00830 [Candidatus Andersenbacteria bacterium]
MATDGRGALRRLLAGARFAVVRTLQESDAEVYVVGGAVRDTLLGRTPTDVDLLVRGLALPDLLAVLRRHGAVHEVGTRFGVLQLVPRVAGRLQPPGIEVALPRTDRPTGRGGYRDVATSSDPGLPVEADLARRDFTINAIAYRVADGQLLDPFSGQADLRAGVLRTVGDPAKRFAEDRSRLLRAVRFAAVLSCTIEPATLAALQAQAPQLNQVAGGRRIVPNETIGRELLLALHAAPRRTVELLDATGLLPHVLPELAACRGIQQSPDFHPEGDIYVHTLDVLGRLPADASPTLVLEALCHDLGKAVAVQALYLAGPRVGEREEVPDPHAYFASGTYDPRIGAHPKHRPSRSFGSVTRALVERLVLTQFARDADHPLDVAALLHAVRYHLLQDIEHMRPSKAEHRALCAGRHGPRRPGSNSPAPIPPRCSAGSTRTPSRGSARSRRSTTPRLNRSWRAAAAARWVRPDHGRLRSRAAFYPASPRRDAQLSGEATDTQSALAFLRARFPASASELLPVR